MSNTKYAQATHSDGDGLIHLRFGDADKDCDHHETLTKEQAMFFMMELAKAISDEFGDFSASKPVKIKAEDAYL